MKHLNKISIFFFFSLLHTVVNVRAQSKTNEPVNEEKKKSETDVKANVKSADTKSDKALDLYMHPPVTPNQSGSSTTKDKQKSDQPK